MYVYGCDGLRNLSHRHYGSDNNGKDSGEKQKQNLTNLN